MSAAAALEFWRAHLAADGKRPSRDALAAAQAALEDPSLLLLVTGDGFAAGHVEDDLLRLEAVVVAPGVRRQGRGGALADALADLAYAQGARRLTATAPDERAAAFYAACGLDQEGEQWVGELEPPMRDLVAKIEGLRLGQLLKLAELVETGAEAKALLAEGGVLVNGEPELRRGRQMTAGDIVVARDVAVRLVPSD
ncbi:MAG: hypothetical protein JWL64_2424 [Frankiales bacterium]|nr:hypothetical protein [Frankiales bacterium]